MMDDDDGLDQKRTGAQILDICLYFAGNTDKID